MTPTAVSERSERAFAVMHIVGSRSGTGMYLGRVQGNCMQKVFYNHFKVFVIEPKTCNVYHGKAYPLVKHCIFWNVTFLLYFISTHRTKCHFFFPCPGCGGQILKLMLTCLYRHYTFMEFFRSMETVISVFTGMIDIHWHSLPTAVQAWVQRGGRLSAAFLPNSLFKIKIVQL